MILTTRPSERPSNGRAASPPRSSGSTVAPCAPLPPRSACAQDERVVLPDGVDDEARDGAHARRDARLAPIDERELGRSDDLGCEAPNAGLRISSEARDDSDADPARGSGDYVGHLAAAHGDRNARRARLEPARARGFGDRGIEPDDLMALEDVGIERAGVAREVGIGGVERPAKQAELPRDEVAAHDGAHADREISLARGEVDRARTTDELEPDLGVCAMQVGERAPE